MLVWNNSPGKELRLLRYNNQEQAFFFMILIQTRLKPFRI